MLPCPARRPAQQVHRARLDQEFESGRPRGCRAGHVGPELHHRVVVQRDADDVLEVGHVAVPAQRCAGPVLGDQHVAEVFGPDAGPCGHLGPQRMQRLGQRRARLEAVGVEVVAAAEAGAAAPRRVFLVAHLLERQALHDSQQFGLFGGAQKAALVAQALDGRHRRLAEQVGLGGMLEASGGAHLPCHLPSVTVPWSPSASPAIRTCHQRGSSSRISARAKRSSSRCSTPLSSSVRITRPAACTTFCRPG